MAKKNTNFYMPIDNVVLRVGQLIKGQIFIMFIKFNSERMITPLFLSIPPGTTYEKLKDQINFVEDFAGVSNWVMRTPRIIYGSDLRTKHTFTPQGIHVQRINEANLDERWKYFVITKGDAKRYYCTAQIYYQKGHLKVREGGYFSSVREVYRQFYLPKCLVLLSELPYYKVQVNLLKIFKQLKKQQPVISHSVNQNLYRIFMQLADQGRQNQWEHIAIREINQGRKITPPIEFTFNYYISMCNEHRLGQAIFLQKNTNRQVLHLYKLQNNSFYQVSYFFHLPFSTPTLRQIISAILQEKQIIFTSNNSNLTTLVIETFMRVILPLKWCYMYVPNLPDHLLQPAQECFMPFIVGISRKNLQQLDLSERFVVFIEENRVEYSGQLVQFHSSLNEHLMYYNKDQKNYLEWQKQIRIKSLLLMHSILEDCMIQESPKSQRSLHNSFVSLGGPEHNFRSMQRFPSSGLLREDTHFVFIEELVNNSMMYKHFKEDNSRGLAQETIRIIHIPRQQRRNYITSKFNVISSQAQYPVRIDNQRRWIRYYDRMNDNRRKFRFNRYSLNPMEGSMLKHSFGIPYSGSLVSNSRLLDSRMLTQSTVFH